MAKAQGPRNSSCFSLQCPSCKATVTPYWSSNKVPEPRSCTHLMGTQRTPTEYRKSTSNKWKKGEDFFHSNSIILYSPEVALNFLHNTDKYTWFPYSYTHKTMVYFVQGSSQSKRIKQYLGMIISFWIVIMSRGEGMGHN